MVAITKQPINGFLLVNKPIGLSSTQTMAKARKLLAAKKAGHGGTLDPFASGLLLVAFGEATKALPYILSDNKEYKFTLRFGTETDSQDITGHIVATSDHIPSRQTIENILPQFIGKTLQTPPIFSAIKINGVRSYDIARHQTDHHTGKKPSPRPIRIDDLRLIEQSNINDFVFGVRGQSGLYVRTLGHDIAKKLDSVGHLIKLQRIAIGNFLLNDAFSLAKLEKMDYSQRVESTLIDFSNKNLFTEHDVEKNLATLMGLESIFLNKDEAFALRLGRKIITNQLNLKEKNKKLDILLAIDPDQRPVGFVSYQAKTIIPKRIFIL
ncbi:MAG: tRNA pseudouridine(55) synthase TruB [Alphaproteobacteria bacterium]